MYSLDNEEGYGEEEIAEEEAELTDQTDTDSEEFDEEEEVIGEEDMEEEKEKEVRKRYQGINLWVSTRKLLPINTTCDPILKSTLSKIHPCSKYVATATRPF